MDTELHSRAVALLTEMEEWVQPEGAWIAEMDAEWWSGFTGHVPVEIPDEWVVELVKIEDAMGIGEGDGDLFDRARRCVDASS